MRKILLFFRAIAIGSILLFGSGFVMGQVIISQYIETSSGTYPKGIEVWNVSGSTIDFSVTNLDLFQGTNGAAPVLLYSISSGTFENGATIVIGTPQAVGELATGTGFKDFVEANGAVFYTKAFTFNGDDALVLYLNDVITDVFGNPGSDPGTGWSGNGVQTYNQNISIKSSINVGDTDGWIDPSERFEVTTTDNSLTGFGIAPVLASVPTITVNPSTLTGFSYDYGNGPSAEQSFTISGADLTDDITITPPTNYEISSDNISYQLTPITLTQTGGTVSTTTIYTRLQEGLSAGTYDEDITASSADAVDKTVTCSGSVITPSSVIINEVDADTPGTDTAEFIELYDEGVGNTPLDGMVLVLFNGNGDVSYAAYDLDTYSTNGSGYFVVGNAGVTNVDITFADNFLQNGADAVALYFGNASDFPNGTVVTTTNLIDAFVYDTDDADDPGLLVLINASEPQVNENGRGNKEFQSSQRFPNGTGGARNTSTYDQTYPTPGAANKGNATWIGTNSNNWETIGNWANAVPTADHDVYIASGLSNYPTISSSANCNTILIEDGASLIGAEYLTVGGTATMQRSIPAYTTAADGWHLLSSPMNNMAIAASDFAPLADDDFYAWYESTYTWLNYKVSANNITNFVNGSGYLVAYQTAATKDFVGTFNSADIPLTNLSKTIAGNGWNLLGNPFQSAIEWNSANWGISGISAGAKIMNNGGSYSDIANGGIIPANQGFFVQALDASNSITIPASQRVHSSTAFYKSEPVNVLSLKASDGDFYVETSIQIMDGATLGFDAAYDMNFLGGMQNAPYLYSAISETEKLSTNRIAPIEQLTEVPLAFKSFLDKEYTLSTPNANSFESDIDVYLKDKVANITVNLKETPEYTFIATAGELTDRFVIQLFKSSTSLPNIEFSGVQIFSNGEQVFLRSDKNSKAALTVYNMLGQEVYFKNIVLGGLQTIDLNQKAGCYIVQLVGEQGLVKEKVFIK